MRSKYINTFNTTAEYDNYIDSAYPEFPNVALDKEAGKIKIMNTSPNDHVIYGELNDPTQIPLFVINRVYPPNVTPTVDTTSNTFYVDESDLPNSITSLYGFCNANRANILSFKKINFDTSNVRSLYSSFIDCQNLTYIDFSACDFSNVTDTTEMFSGCTSLLNIDLSSTNISNKLTNASTMFNKCNSMTSLNLNNCDFSNASTNSNLFGGVWSAKKLTDVYINIEGTLNKLTNNLSSATTNPYSGQYIPDFTTIHYNGTDYKWQNNAWTPQS